MDKRYFSDKLVEWYQENKRNLPWRDTRDPYKIWLSEIILQQTRVAQGLPYYQRFVERFPDVTALARASQQEVLRLWQGLGYYTRARNLHRCAQVVADEYQGSFPTTFEALRRLPGIGDYTAAAIASFAFREAVAVVDGNVFRVLSRVWGIDDDIATPAGKKKFASLANELINARKPDLHNQAMMEFGALHCTPKTPACDQCLFQKKCFAATHQLQLQLPVKGKAKKARRRYFYYIVIQKGKSLMMRPREHKDIWQGLYDFPLIEKSHAAKPEQLADEARWLKSLAKETWTVSDEYKHVLTHQVIIARFVLIRPKTTDFSSPETSASFYAPARMADLPKPVLINRFLHDYKFL